MQKFYGDFHIHIGRAGGKAVKITASDQLQLHSILFEDAPRKGLDVIGIVDSGSLAVSREIEELLEKGDLKALPRGGFLAKNGVLFIPGCEIESREGIHLIAYLPDLNSIYKWQAFFQSRVHNMYLSTQRANAGFIEILNLCLLLDGIFCPAHAFTPHKGMYGVWTDRLEKEIEYNFTKVKVLELGLSADTDMADRIAETRAFTFLTNSDAHSSVNIGREYNLLRMADKNFEEFRMCLENRDGRKVEANFGLHPMLGKYHRSYCPDCDIIFDGPAAVLCCDRCKSDKIVMGVYDRILQIQDYQTPRHPAGRPPYYYRVPLKGLPGIGPKTSQLLLQVYNEIEVLEELSLDQIERLVGQKSADTIKGMRDNSLQIIPGGGGKYGKVKKNTDRN
ncbi:MAG: endonuclease Q family protein [Bacillota bacterium]|nr:endonuclease Q family protein [Bacillota bacterium]